MMMQIQSSWFPRYDRNPQSFVANIFDARPAGHRKATIRVVHAPAQASAIELPVTDDVTGDVAGAAPSDVAGAGGAPAP